MPYVPQKTPLPCHERTVDPEWFFDEGPDRRDKALTLCHGCSARNLCLQEALLTRAQGIWGGTTTRERARMLKERSGRRERAVA